MSERPLTTEDIFARACELLYDGHPQEALAGFEFLADYTPEYPVAHWMQGVALAALERHDEAIGAFQTGLELQPGETKAIWNLALSLAHTGRLQEAMGVLGQAYQAQPDFFDALLFMGHLFAQERGAPVDSGFAQWVLEHERGTFRLKEPLDQHLFALGLVALGERELAAERIEELQEMDAARAAHVEALL